MVNFYVKDVLLEARDLLLADAANLAVEGLPRCARCDNLVKLNIGWHFNDSWSWQNKVTDQLPTYAVKVLDRIPTVSNDDRELFGLLKKGKRSLFENIYFVKHTHTHTHF